MEVVENKRFIVSHLISREIVVKLSRFSVCKISFMMKAAHDVKEFPAFGRWLDSSATFLDSAR